MQNGSTALGRFRTVKLCESGVCRNRRRFFQHWPTPADCCPGGLRQDGKTPSLSFRARLSYISIDGFLQTVFRLFSLHFFTPFSIHPMTSFSRRHFLGAAAATATLGGYSPILSVQAQESTTAAGRPFPSEIFKARITSVPTDEICAAWKSAGFEGMELTKWDATPEEARDSRAIAEKHGLRIHSVIPGPWKAFNQPDRFDAEIESVKTALRTTSIYGADALLLVPAAISRMPMPDPWAFDIDFDPKTLMLKTVVDGDNAPFAAYIAAHNAATESCIRAIEQLIPTASREGVRICIENVWNNLWVMPNIFAAFCSYFDNPWVGAYLDLGNHIRYARVEEWVKAVGHHIIKLHIKGFKITEERGKLGGGPGDWSRIDEASADWRAVRQLLAEKRYNGWLTIEENRADDAEYSEMLDKIIAM